MGPVSYRINADGYIWNRHAEQLQNDETGRVTNSEIKLLLVTVNIQLKDKYTTRCRQISQPSQEFCISNFIIFT